MTVRPVQTVAVLGCGVMGQGIARACAAAGLPTIIFKITPGDPNAVRAKFEYGLGKDVEKGKLKGEDLATIMFNLSWSQDISQDISDIQDCDLVIESVVEDLSKKQELLREIDAFVKPSAILASNTSTLSIAKLASATSRADLFLGLHFFNPVEKMKLVEVVRTLNTEDDVVEAALQFVGALGKTPVVVPNTPGFVVNRLMMNSLLYAIRWWEEDELVSMEAIDQCMNLGLGHPMGPFALCDFIGLDVVLAIAKELCSGLNDARFAPPPKLRYLVQSGMLGKKTKKGFYDYTANPVCPNPALFTSHIRR